jgi:hypothetical protein
VTDDDLEAKPKTSGLVFWRAQEQDLTMVNLLRAKAGLPPFVPDTSAQPPGLGSGEPTLRLP